jgi:hypothetical protein
MLATPAELLRANGYVGLRWQPTPKRDTEAKRLSALLANLMNSEFPA